MPAHWLPQFRKEEGKSRQRSVGATSKVVKNMGQKVVEFVTNDGQARKITCQLTDVNKILACVAMICDGNNFVLYSKTGGMIIPEKDVKITAEGGCEIYTIRTQGKHILHGRTGQAE